MPIMAFVSPGDAGDGSGAAARRPRFIALSYSDIAIKSVEWRSSIFLILEEIDRNSAKSPLFTDTLGWVQRA